MRDAAGGDKLGVLDTAADRERKMRRAACCAALEAKQKLEDTRTQHKVELEQVKAQLSVAASRIDQLRLAKADLDAAVESEQIAVL